MPVLQERFSRVPLLQEENSGELSVQAEQAERTKSRLLETEQEALRALMEEVDATQRIEKEAINSHPMLLQWKQKLDASEENARKWEQEHNQEVSFLEEEIRKSRNQVEQQQQRLGALEADRENVQDTLRNLEEQRARLELEIKEGDQVVMGSRQRADDARQRYQDLQRQLMDARAQLANIEEQQNMITASLEPGRTEIHRMEMHLSQCKGEIEPLNKELADIDVSIQKERYNVRAAEEVINNAKMFMDEYLCDCGQIKDNLESHRRTLTRAQEAKRQAQSLKTKATEVLRDHEMQLPALQSQWKSLVENRDEIQKKISSLQKELANVENRITEHRRIQDEKKVDVHRLEMDINLADGLFSEAQELETNTLNAIQKEEQKSRFEELQMQECNNKQVTAETRLRSFYDNIERLENRREALFTRLGRNQETTAHLEREMPEKQRAFADIKSKQEINLNSLAEIRRIIGELEAAIQSTNNELKVAEEDYNRYRVKHHEWIDQIGLLDRRISELRANDWNEGINACRFAINENTGRIKNLEAKLRESFINPFAREIADLKGQFAAICERAKQDIAANPPPPLRDQMRREAEAVMRAEFAAGLLDRQKHLTEEAKGLARYLVSADTHVQLDDLGAKRLLSEHLTSGERPNYHRIANAVVELSEQKHIFA